MISGKLQILILIIIISGILFISNEYVLENVCNSSNYLHPSSNKTVSLLNSITNGELYKTHGKIDPPAVLLWYKGGIGNQLFQYACHYTVARKNNLPLYIFLKLEDKKAKREFGLYDRKFALDQFNIPLYEWNMPDELWNITGGIAVNDSALLSGSYPIDKTFQQHGMDYCQSEAFFISYKDELMELLSPKIPTNKIQSWIDLISSKEASVAMHIRRGDFVYLNITVPPSFYTGAMERISKILNLSPTFFIFTDDIEFVGSEFINKAEGIGSKYELILVSNPKLNSMEEFVLMSLCHHDIIPTSSFSWWAAYLNRNKEKIVIAAHYDVKYFERIFDTPEYVNYFKWQYKHIYYPIGWITVDPFS